MTVEEVIKPPPSCLVYTPQELADAVLGALGDFDPNALWLEPSCGEGAFVGAMRRKGVDASCITAIDLNMELRLGDLCMNARKGVDFLEWYERCDIQFDRIVGNPPYVRISELPARLKASATLVRQPDGRTVGLRANCWYSFLCASLRLLKMGGSLAFVLPAAWEYAHYAAPVREGIGFWFESVHIYRCLEPLFDEVDDGTVVLIAKAWGVKGGGQILRSEHATRDELISALLGEAERVDGKAEHVCSEPVLGRMVQFKQIARLRIGAVTGDARYFLLPEERRRNLGLPAKVCRPVLSKNRHLAGALINDEVWHSLLKAGEKVWLFSPTNSQLDHPAVKRYLDLPEAEGGCKSGAYKVSNRDPWYRVKLPDAPHAFISGHAPDGPWLALRFMERLTATNTLYSVRFLSQLSFDEMAAWGLALLSTEVWEQWQIRVRTYPAGLKKLEPSDLGNLFIPIIKPRAGMLNTYIMAIGLMLSGKSTAARALVDGLVRKQQGTPC